MKGDGLCAVNDPSMNRQTFSRDREFTLNNVLTCDPEWLREAGRVLPGAS